MRPGIDRLAFAAMAAGNSRLPSFAAALAVAAALAGCGGGSGETTNEASPTGAASAAPPARTESQPPARSGTGGMDGGDSAKTQEDGRPQGGGPAREKPKHSGTHSAPANSAAPKSGRDERCGTLCKLKHAIAAGQGGDGDNALQGIECDKGGRLGAVCEAALEAIEELNSPERGGDAPSGGESNLSCPPSLREVCERIR